MPDPFSPFADADDANLDELTQPLRRPALTPAPRGVSPFADADAPDPLPGVVQRAGATPPDTAGRVLALQAKTGLPADLISRNLEDVTRQAAARDFDAAAFRKSSPLLATWLEANPMHAAVAKDDLGVLGHVEQAIRYVTGIDTRRGMEHARGYVFAVGEVVGEAAGAQGLEDTGEAGRKMSEAAAATYGPAREFTSSLGSPLEFGRYVQELIGDQIPVMAPVIGSTLLGARIGSAGGPWGALIGGVVGAFVPSFVMGVGEQQSALKGKGEEFSDPTAVFLGGSAVAALDTAFPAKIGGRLFRAFGKETAEAIAGRFLRTPVKQAWYRQAGKEMASEGITEALQEAITEVTAATATGTPIDPALGWRMLNAGAAGAILGGGISAATSPIEARAERKAHEAAQAQYQAHVLTTLGPALANATSTTVAPAAVEAFVASVTKDGAMQRVYAPVAFWNEYFQSKGQDPAAIAAVITGDPQIYETALKSGEDLVIPFARYAVAIAATEHNAAFAAEVRFRPGDMNAREAIAYQQALATPPGAAASPAVTGASEARAEHIDMLIARGATPGDAEMLADLNEGVLGQFAARAQIVEPAPFYRSYGLELQVPGYRPPAAPAPLAPEAREAIAAPAVEPGAAETDELYRNIRAALDEAAPTPLPPAEAPGGEAVPVVAAFRHYRPDADGRMVAQYDVIGGPADKSTKGADELAALGIAIPVTPPYDAVREQAARDARQRALDEMFGREAAAAAAEGRPNDTGTESPSPDDGPRRRITIGRVHESIRASRRESPTARDARRTKHYAAVYKEIKTAAQILDPAVDLKALRAAFNERVAYAEEADQEWTASGENPRVFLEAIAAAGGISLAAEASEIGGGYTGELRRLRESVGPYGSFAGVRGVFQAREVGKVNVKRAGIGVDEMLTRLQQDPKFSYLETASDVFATLDDAARVEHVGAKGRVNYPGTEELRKRVGIDPNKDWWKPADEQLFNQGLFDEDEQVDTLDTGEQQPRLPGAGEVRDVEVPTPELEAPFALTAEVSTRKGKQETLFQPFYHGSPHSFDRFSTEKIGTGEGAAAYGWGLYFAENKDVATGYRERLAGKLLSKQLAVDGERIYESGGAWHVEEEGHIRAGLSELQARAYFLNPETVDVVPYLRDMLTRTIANYKAEREAGRTMSGDAAVDVYRVGEAEDALAALDKYGDRLTLKPAEQPGGLYQVEIKDTHVAKMLDWDAPLAAQPAPVKALVRAELKKQKYLAESDNGPRVLTRAWAAWRNEHGGFSSKDNGELVYEMLADAEATRLVAPQLARKAELNKRNPGSDLRRRAETDPVAAAEMAEWIQLDAEINRGRDDSKKLASLALEAAGVPGLKYFDGQSRDTKRGTRNVVAFSDAIVTLTHKDGTPVSAEERETFFQPMEAKFYSRLVRAVEESKANKATGAQWKGQILNAKIGTNKDEFAYARVGDLEDGKSYTKQEVLDYLAANEVALVDVTLAGEGVADIDQDDDAINDRARELRDTFIDREMRDFSADLDDYAEAEARYNEDEEYWEAFVDNEDVGDTYRTEAEALEKAEEVARERNDEAENEAGDQRREYLEESVGWDDFYDTAREELIGESTGSAGGTQYGEYVEKGAVREDSYREVFLTVPAVQATPFTAEELEFQALRERAAPHQWMRDAQPLTPPERDRLEELSATVGASANQKSFATSWVDGHEPYDDIANPIVRLRFNIRETSGGPTLFLEEVQTPHANQFAKMPPLLQKNWRAIAFKWALRYAAEHDLTAVAWTSGAMQAARYSLEKEVDQITWGLVDEGGPLEAKGASRFISINTKQQSNIRVHVNAAGVVLAIGSDPIVARWAGAPLENVLGKGVAEAVLAKDNGLLEGEGLKIGGEGLKRLYDVDFRNVVNAIPAVKKLGGKVDKVDVTLGSHGRFVWEGSEPTAAELEAKAAELNQTGAGGDRGRADRLLRIAFMMSEEGHEVSFRDAWDNYGLPGLARLLGRDMKEVITTDTAPVPALLLTPELATSVLGGQALFQPRMPDENRGSIRFGTDPATGKPKTVITLGRFKNKSTFLHEMAHLYLRMYGDLVEALGTYDPATLTAVQQKFLADYEGLRVGIGVAPGAEIEREHHERFARMWEAYLRTGKAPSRSLRAAFAAFRNWLVKIYPSLQALNVELSPEIVDIFNRMLASDAAIAEVESDAVAPMFTDARAAGMSEAAFANYRDTIQAASTLARQAVDAKLLADGQKTAAAEWRRKRAVIREAVEFELSREPVYQALAAFQRGTYPNGTPIVLDNDEPPPKLARAAIVAEFGPARLRALPRPSVVTAGPGLTPGEAADLYGFSSGDALLTALGTAQPLRAAIEQETDRRLAALVADVLTDGTLVAEAQAATANAAREAVVRAELRALAELKRLAGPIARQAAGEVRKEQAYERRWLEAEARLRIAIAEGRKQVEIDALQAELDAVARTAAGAPAAIKAALPPQALVRESAEARVAATKIRDLQPHVFWAAAMRANKTAIAAAAAQDLDAAIAAQQQYLVNLTLFRESTRALADAERRVEAAKQLGTVAARKRLGLAGQGYLEQVDKILERYEFATVSRPVMDRRASLLKWIAAQGADYPLELPPLVLEEAHRVNYRELTIAELVDVSDGLTMIVHHAQLKARLLKAQTGRDLHAKAAELAASIRRSTTQRRPSGPQTRLPMEQRIRDLDGIFAAHRKMSSLAYQIDGFTDGGAMATAIMYPLNAAGAQEAAMNADATRRLSAIVDKAYPRRQKGTLYDKREHPAIGLSLTKMNVLMLALNWGNTGSRQRIMSGYGWSEAQVAAVLDTLDRRDWVFVQDVWDFVNSYWPAIVAKQERVTGVAPKKVEAAPFQTKFGEQRGGYFPLKGDDQQSARVAQHVDLEGATFQRQAAYVNVTTQRGFTKDRVENASYPVLLDSSVLFNHVRQVIHDLSHHEALIDVGRVLGHRLVQDAIYETYGDQVYRQFTTGIRDVAQGDKPAANAFERGINHFRMGTTVALLAWSLSTTLMQPLGLTQSMVRIGPIWVARGMGKWFRDAAHMENSVAWITERSLFMRTRFATQQRELNEIRNQVGVTTGRLSGWVDEALSKTTFDQITRQGIADSYFWMIGVAQRVADVPTWLGQYEKSMALGETEERAIQIADQAVLDSQAGGQTKDLAAVQRGGPMLKLWTNFYSFFSATFNLAAEAKGKRGSLKNPLEVGRLAVDYLLLFTLPATLGYLIRAAMGGSDEDEGWLEALARENVSYMMGTMLGLRELSGAVKGYANYSGPAGGRVFASLNRLTGQVLEGEVDTALLRALNDTAGAVFHYPAGQTWRTLTGLVAIVEGKTQNPGALVVGPPKEPR